MMINAYFAYVAFPPSDSALEVLLVLILVFHIVVVCGAQRLGSRNLNLLELVLGSGQLDNFLN